MVATEGLREMEGSALRRLVCRDEAAPAGGPGRCLVLDCRPFLAHSAGHIRGALNVRCNTIVRRRAKGAVSLEQILPAEGEVRARLRAGLYAAVVVYDERSPRAEALREDSTVALVVRALRRDTARADIRLLAGTGEGDPGGAGTRRRAAPNPGSGARPRPAPALPLLLLKLGGGQGVLWVLRLGGAPSGAGRRWPRGRVLGQRAGGPGETRSEAPAERAVGQVWASAWDPAWAGLARRPRG